MRIWNIRINLDLLARDMAGLEGDAEQAAYLRGLAAGAQGLPAREGATQPWLAGHGLGSASYAEAEARSAAAAAAGRSSARARGGPSPTTVGTPVGTAAGTDDQTVGERDGNDCSNDRSNDCSNLSNKPINDKPPIEDMRAFALACQGDSPALPDADRWRFVAAEPWARTLRRCCKIGPQSWPAWKRLVEERGLDPVVAAAGSLPASDRWWERVEEVLAGVGAQSPSLGAAVAGKTRRLA